MDFKKNNLTSLSQRSSFVSKIPKFKGTRVNSIGTRKSGDLLTLHQQNIKLRDMVIVVANKLESFIEKTIEVKKNKRLINKVRPQPDNEVY